MLRNKVQNLLSYALQKHGQVREMSVLRKSLKFCKFGEPAEVLELVEDELDDPKDKEILVKMLAAPINPADINTIQGKYPVKPQFPAIGGNEFVGLVECVGKKVDNIKPGDKVVPAINALGAWTSHGIFTQDQLKKIPYNILTPEAATLTVNPCTAYRMLKDFTDLIPGDCVIQNGANSAVGQAVHQLCREWKIESIGIVRDRPDIQELKDYLKKLGASEVLTEEELRKTTIFKDSKYSPPRLALNCVGGKSATEISRHLRKGGVMVTYGGMSREPVVASTAALIFKDISFRGFWMTRWSQENAKSEERTCMFNELCELMESGKFVAPAHEMIPLDKYKEAVEGALNFKGFTGKKYILDMSR